MKKITIFSLHLGYGGIENAVVSFVNNMYKKYDITIVSVYKLYSKPIYHINDNVHIIYLIDNNIALRMSRYKKTFIQSGFKSFFKLIWDDYVKHGQIIKLFKDFFISIKTIREKTNKTANYMKNMKTDIVITTRDFFNELASTYVDDKVLKIAWEHNYGSAIYIEHVAITCRNINKIVLVSKELQQVYSTEMKKLEYKTECIYIPNIVDSVPNLISNLKSNKIVSVGRLAEEKGYLDLIDVFNIMYKKNKDLSLEIIGDGDQLPLLKSKIDELKLNEVVTLSGFQNKEYINKVLHESSLFLMSSFTESFGIVLIEAMSNGVPCIAFDSAEGAREIIEDGTNGYLIKDRNKKEMANKALSLLDNRKKLKELGFNAKYKSEQFNAADVFNMWDQIL